MLNEGEWYELELREGKKRRKELAQSRKIEIKNREEALKDSKDKSKESADSSSASKDDYLNRIKVSYQIHLGLQSLQVCPFTISLSNSP